MDARVGAKLEVVAPRRLLTPTDYGYLFALLAVSLALHGWLVSRTQVTARDGLEFARTAMNLGEARMTAGATGETVAETVRRSVHPPGYPLAILAVSQFLPAGEPQFRLLKAAQLTSLLAAALAVFPTYWLGRMLFSSPFIGFAGALIFQTLPTIAHLTSDAVSESLYLLFATTALVFGTRGLRRRSPGMMLLAGLFAGVTYLVRPEGLMLPLALGLSAAGAGILRTWTRGEALGHLLALGIGFAMVGGPYMLAIGGVSNKATFNELLDRLKGKAPRPLWQGEANAAPRAPVLLADFHQEGNLTAWAATAIVKETSKAAHYATFFLGLAGLALQRRRIGADPGLSALPLFAAVNLAVIGALALKIGYVSERHTVMIVLVLSLFAASGLESIWMAWGRLPRIGGRGLLVLIVAGSLPSAVKVPHESRAGHPHAGRYLAMHVGPQDAVIDPFCWAEWYAGRTLHAVPPDPVPPAARWVVMETGRSPHSRLPRYRDALNVVTDGANPAKLVYWWPEDLPETEAREKAKVLVYRQDVRTP
jgi:Dolichyl-phosphate-mannose-protein mannosyltransferase